MLSPNEYRALDGVALAGLVREKEITASEVLECAIQEMDRLNPALNAIVMRNYDQARTDAKAMDISLPLAGVPFPAKDVNVHVKHFQTTYACRFFADAPVQDTDSLLVRRWREAGLIIPARTNTPEFATDFGCEPEMYGPVNNPWNLSLTPGGSSGGAAVAVASGMVPMAHGSDSGGSIRVPASCCGVFGFKPSSGLVATGSSLGHLVGGLNCDHAISRTVRDSAALLDVTAGPETAAPTVYSKPVQSFLSELDSPPRRLRIGVTELSPTGLTANTEFCTKLNETARVLEGLGHKIFSWSWPENADACDVASYFWVADIAMMIDQYADLIGRPPEEGELGPLVRWSLQKAHRTDSVDMVQAQEKLRDLQLAMTEATNGIDVLLTPVTTEPPLETGLLSNCVNKDIGVWLERAWRFAPYPEIFNITGQPAMSVPLHVSEDGLPIGMHFASSVGNDALLFKLAKQLEEAMPWINRRPPEAVGSDKNGTQLRVKSL